MSKFKRTPLAALVLALLSAGAMACSDSSQEPVVPSPLTGLLKSQASDSAPAAQPGNPVPSTPGAIHGIVLGQSEPGSGPDTLATAARVANVAVTAYKPVGSGANVTAGEKVGETVTSENGEFHLPTLPGGDYLVTFVPPADSKYRGVWVTGPVNSQTDQWRWYIVLSKK